jgi:hypothetical protein
VVSITPRSIYPRERPGTHFTGGWVGPRAGLDVCEKSRPHRDFFFGMLRFCSYLVLHCSGIGLSMFFVYRTSLFLDCKGRLDGVIINTLAPRNFPPSPPEDAAYWPYIQRTPLAKEGTNGIWPAISQFFEETWVLLHAPKLVHGTDYFTSPPKEVMLWIFPAILGTGDLQANH